MVGAGVEAFDALEVLEEIRAQGRVDVTAPAMPGSISFCTRGGMEMRPGRGRSSFTSVAKLMVTAMISSFWRAR